MFHRFLFTLSHRRGESLATLLMKINFVCRQVYKDVNLLLLFVLLSFAYYRNLMFYAIFHCSWVGPRVRSRTTCIPNIYTCEQTEYVYSGWGDDIQQEIFVIVVGSLFCGVFGWRAILAIRKIIVICIIFVSPSRSPLLSLALFKEPSLFKNSYQIGRNAFQREFNEDEKRLFGCLTWRTSLNK